MAVTSLGPASFARGCWYYAVSLLAALYLLAHSASRQARTIVRHAWRWTAAADDRGDSRRGKQRQAVRQADLRQAAQAKALEALGLGTYTHACDAAPGARPPPPPTAGPWSFSDYKRERRTILTRDHTLVSYTLVNPGGARTMVLANGLGLSSNCCEFAAIVHRYGRAGGGGDWSFLTWEYRGLFQSDQPRAAGAPSPRPRRLAIPNHAEDLAQILTREGRRADVLLGYSMGVQVALEFASLYPARLDRLVLVNGTYGSVLDSALQPFFRIPGLAGALSSGIELILDHSSLLHLAARAARPVLWIAIKLYKQLLQQELLAALLGEDYFQNFLEAYVLDFLRTSTHTMNHLRLFQELQAHCTYHLLRHIETPTLIVSGLLDPLTPAFLSFEMARRMPNAKHVVAYLASHCVLLEAPVLLLRELSAFLETTDWATLPTALASRPLAQGPPTPTHALFHRAAMVSAALHGEEGVIAGEGAWCEGESRSDFAAAEYSRSRARRGTYDEGDLAIDDHAALKFESDDASDADEDAAAAEAAARDEYSIEALLGETLDCELAAEDIPSDQELAAFVQEQATTSSESPEFTPNPAPTRRSKPRHTAVEGAATSDSALASASSAMVASSVAIALPSPAVSSLPGRPVAVLTCADQNERKHDDLALIRDLRAAGVPAEHVVWNAPTRPFSEYAAVVTRSVWGYFKQPTEWLRALEDLDAAGVHVANSVAILRWNSNKMYLRDMATAAASNPEPGFDFIPTVWLRQVDLTCATLEGLLVSHGWSCGAVLKPTSSAGGFATVQLPTVGTVAFASAVAVAAAANLQAPVTDASSADHAAPTWMLQPFQPQIVTDGEYSFFFLLTDGESSPELRFIHAGNKKPRSGSFLVQPTNGGVLTPFTPTAAMVRAARCMIDATPFAQTEFSYVRVDCIRAADEHGLLTDRLLLMEIEAIEPDFYSHLTPNFARLYFESVRGSLQRARVWDGASQVVERTPFSSPGAGKVVPASSSSFPSPPACASYEHRANHVEQLLSQFELDDASAEPDSEPTESMLGSWWLP